MEAFNDYTFRFLETIDKYKDSERLFSFYQRNSSHAQFNRAVNEHLKVIGKALNIDDLTFYAARHSWATIARNDCGIPMEDIAICLNHKSRYKKRLGNCRRNKQEGA